VNGAAAPQPLASSASDISAKSQPVTANNKLGEHTGLPPSFTFCHVHLQQAKAMQMHGLMLMSMPNVSDDATMTYQSVREMRCERQLKTKCALCSLQFP
jgi:hypothetical protein